MGIQGLLPLLKDIQVSPTRCHDNRGGSVRSRLTPFISHRQEHTHVSQYRGQTLGIDGYVWLHRGAYACAEKLVKGEYTTKYINYAMYRIRMLRHHGVKPFVVFDGGHLPSKAKTEDERESRRRENLERAMMLSKQGRQGPAFEAFAKCLDITPEIAYQLIKALKAEGVDYAVAPYEADAQLAYLEKEGIIDAIVTEDSDLLVFGCRNVLFKMGSDGECVRILQSRFTACKSVSFAGWTTDRFRQMAILSGCDYLPSISGMGLKNAHKLLQRYKTVSKVLQAVRLEGRMRVPPSYHQQFEQAEKTFLYQRVWDPRSEQLTTLNPLPDDVGLEALQYIGPEMPQEVARGIAEGEIDPISRKAMTDIMPSFLPASAVKGAGKAIRGPEAAQRGIKAFFGKAAAVAKRVEDKVETELASSSSTPSRRPLAPRDTNARPAGAVSTPIKDSATTTPVRSLFFGGQTKGVNRNKREVEVPLKQSDATDPPAHTAALLPCDATSFPISGMGDFFCELDGADPRLLMSEDEGSPKPAFKDIVLRDSEEERLPWDSDRCPSEVSDVLSTPRKARSERSNFSSPLAFDEDDDGEEHTGRGSDLLQGTKSGLAQTLPPLPETTEGNREHDQEDCDDVVSSPSSRASDTSPTLPAHSSHGANVPYPGSPLQGRSLAKKRKLTYEEDDHTHERSSLAGSPSCSDSDGEADEGPAASLTPGPARAGNTLWERFSRTPSAPMPSTSTSASKPALRTPSGRPLRLYSSSTPAVHTPFLTRSATTPVAGSVHTAGTPHGVGSSTPGITGRRSISASAAATTAAAARTAPRQDSAIAKAKASSTPAPRARPSLDLSYFSFDQKQAQAQGGSVAHRGGLRCLNMSAAREQEHDDDDEEVESSGDGEADAEAARVEPLQPLSARASKRPRQAETQVQRRPSARRKGSGSARAQLPVSLGPVGLKLDSFRYRS